MICRVTELLSVKEHKFAEMSTWQQILYAYVQVSTNTSTSKLLEYKYKYQVLHLRLQQYLPLTVGG